MSSRASATLAGLVLAVLVAGCSDPAADRVSLVSAPQPTASPQQPSSTVHLPQPSSIRSKAGDRSL
ncbi:MULTISPECIES: hypothetical protein [unclassified Nonomuraea]|uniref:hypothetical protein n=1 Tax=unclassified Nonomuraea TaxID=2593643 RepID=UPI00340F7120